MSIDVSTSGLTPFSSPSPALQPALQRELAVNENQEPNFGSSSVIARSPTPTQKLPLTPRRTANTEGVLGTLRRELKVAEERLAERVENVEHRVEQFRDAAFAAMKDMFSDLSGVQAQYDRKLSEMGGTVKGVNNEVQFLVQRVGGGMDVVQSQRKEMDMQAFRAKVDDRITEKMNSLEDMVNEKIHVLQMSFDLLQVNVEDLAPKAEALVGQLKDMQGRMHSMSDRTDRMQNEITEKLDNRFRVHVDDAEDARKKHRLEISEIRRTLDNTHWAAIIELKEALEKVNEHYSLELKTIKEYHLSNAAPGRPTREEFHESDDIQGLLVHEVGELKNSIHLGQKTIQELVPRLLDACQNGREDVRELMAAAKTLEAMNSPGTEATFDQSLGSRSPDRDEWRSSPYEPPKHWHNWNQDGTIADAPSNRMLVNPNAPTSTSCFGSFLERLATYY